MTAKTPMALAVPSSGGEGHRWLWLLALADELSGKLGKRHRDALDVVQIQELCFVARRFLRQHRPVPVGGPLHDLLREGALDLRREAASEEEEASVLADILHGFRDWRLDVDFGQNLDKV